MLLSYPEPRTTAVPVISVDDHQIEPSDRLDGQIPSAPIGHGRRSHEADDEYQYRKFLWDS